MQLLKQGGRTAIQNGRSPGAGTIINGYLAHHGIWGQKWGIRRFQNKDGTRTPAGKARRRKEPTSSEPDSKQSNPYGAGRAATQDEYNRHAKDAVRFGKSATNRILKKTMAGKSYRSVVAQEYAIKIGKTAAKMAVSKVASAVVLEYLPQALPVLAFL